LSPAEATPGATKADALSVHSATIGAGQPIEGGVVSTTVTEDWQDAPFPQASLAVNAVTVVPSGKAPSEGLVTATGLQTSPAVAAPGSTTACRFPVHSAITGAGQEMLGAVVSRTVNVTMAVDCVEPLLQ